MRSIKLLLVILLVILSLSGCNSKSKNLRDFENLVKSMDKITINSEENIEAAKNAYQKLTFKERTEEMSQYIYNSFQEKETFWYYISKAKPLLEKYKITDLESDKVLGGTLHRVHLYSEQFNELSNEEKLMFFYEIENYGPSLFIRTSDDTIFTSALAADGSPMSLCYASEDGEHAGKVIFTKVIGEAPEPKPTQGGNNNYVREKRCKGCGKYVDATTLSGGGYCPKCARNNLWKDSTDADVWWGY